MDRTVPSAAAGPSLKPTVPWGTARTRHLEIGVHWPGGRVPVSLVIDDPMPGLNPMIDHQPSYPHRRHVPNDVLRRFADLSEAHGLRGKFSVVPWPLALGRIDRPETLPPETSLRRCGCGPARRGRAPGKWRCPEATGPFFVPR